MKTATIGTLYLLTLAVATNIACTQFVAAQFGYHAALGTPLYAHFYNPFEWWGWAFKFYDHSPLIYSKAFGICAIGIVIAMAGLRVIVGINSRSSRKHEGVHGTAHFATLDEVKQSGLMGQKQGVYCGGYEHPETGKIHYLRHNGPEHIAVIAPPRSGKGVGNIVPTLLSWLDSVVTLDIKGENYAMTAGWRKQGAKSTILRFDPAEENSCSWNPLGEIRFDTRYQIGDAQSIALMVIDDDGKGLQGNHFRSAAFELLLGLIIHALYKSRLIGRMPCLQDCAHMLTSVGPFAVIEEERFDDGDPRGLAGLFAEMQNTRLDEMGEAAQEAQLVINGVGHRMANTPSRELGSIISTANNALSLYRDPIVGENTSRNDFKIDDLMDHSTPISLYFISAPNNLSRLTPLIRLFVTRVVMGLTGQMTYDDGRSKTAHKHQLLLMLDEFAALGRMDVFEKAMAYISGYGIKACIIVQDRQQLLKAYTRDESILSNCHVQVAYAPNNIETAEWLSKMAGQTTVVKEQITTSGKRFGGFAQQFSRSYQEVQRPLLTPQEVRNLPKAVKDGNGNIIAAGEMLIFAAGMQVIRGTQILYFLDPTFSERSKIAPPKKSDCLLKKGSHNEEENNRNLCS